MTRDEVIAILRSAEGRDETRRVYKLGVAVDFVERTIYSRQVSRTDAEQMTNAVAKIAEELFPGSEETFAIIYGRRLRRVIDEVFGSSS
jgi:tRNA(Ser,Leu) C12 N-acetylase TAN1